MTTTEQQPSTLDEAKLNAFIGKAVDDWGTLTSAALVVIGDKLGLYTALAEGGPATPGELAQRTGTVELYVRPWLINQAAGGYLDYDATAGRYNLPPEHAAALGAVVGAYYLFTAAIKAEPRITAAFKTGQGMLWSEHDAALFAGTERFFRPGYEQNLVHELDPGAGRRRGQATDRRHGRRRWLRPRRLHADPGAGVSALALRRLRQSRGVHPARSPGAPLTRAWPTG